MRRTFLLLCTLFLATAAAAKDAAQLQLDLRRLGVVGGALYVAAHPDDENTAMLAWLANERLLRTAYLSVTRGDGGQNLIGQETGPLLGIIRTQELLQARRIDGAEQMFTRAIDFGYSKTATETLQTWDHDAVLADVVWAIRRFQPDVIVTRFPPTGEGGHGHHTSSAILAEEAFVAAADPARFPEQLRHVSPWQAKRILWNRFSFGRPIDPNDPSVAKSLRVDLGTYNPLLGRAYTEIAAVSRSQHKSQGFGSAERRGTVINYFDHRAGDPATKDLFEGIDTSWARYPGGEKVGALLKEAADGFDPDQPQRSVPALVKALAAAQQLAGREGWKIEQRPWLQQRLVDINDAIRDCAGIAIDLSAADSSVTRGSELPVSVTVVNRSDYPFRLSMIGSTYAVKNPAPGTPLENNKPVKTDITLKMPAGRSYSQPYWLVEDPKKGLYTVTDQRLIGLPDVSHLSVIVTLDDPQGNTFFYNAPVVFRWTDPVKGEQTRDVDVVPGVSLKTGSNVYVFPDAKPRPVSVWMRSYGPVEGTLQLAMPEGWKAEPASVPVKLAAKGEESQVTFTVTPPAGESTSALRAQLTTADGTVLYEGIVDVDYPHIPAQRVLGDATAKLVRADIRHRGTSIGYIMGSGDDIPNILRQVGYEVTLLNDADLDRADFAKYDAIVAGIRAYNTRDRLRLAHEKLMQYVENGGTMVVQYNTANQLDDLAVPVPGPYPFKITRDRVTVEEAPVKLLAPAHAVLNTPNRITAKDFDGWVQERGLYFTSDWDPRYTAVLATNDPGEPEKPGGQLVATHGKGTFVYTGFAWWRQLPAGVPGAIRAFVNLVSQ